MYSHVGGFEQTQPLQMILMDGNAAERIKGALEALRHHPDPEARKDADGWLQRCEAHRDFKELPTETIGVLHSALYEFLKKSCDNAPEMRKKICLAMASLFTHFPMDKWSNGINWIKEETKAQGELAPCLLELLVCIAEETSFYKSCHSQRSKQFEETMRASAGIALSLLDDLISRKDLTEQVILAISAWLPLCDRLSSNELKKHPLAHEVLTLLIKDNNLGPDAEDFSDKMLHAYALRLHEENKSLKAENSMLVEENRKLMERYNDLEKAMEELRAAKAMAVWPEEGKVGDGEAAEVDEVSSRPSFSYPCQDTVEEVCGHGLQSDPLPVEIIQLVEVLNDLKNKVESLESNAKFGEEKSRSARKHRVEGLRNCKPFLGEIRCKCSRNSQCKTNQCPCKVLNQLCVDGECECPKKCIIKKVPDVGKEASLKGGEGRDKDAKSVGANLETGKDEFLNQESP